MAKKPGWSNAELWQSLRDGSGCPICQRGHPLAIGPIASSPGVFTRSDEALTQMADALCSAL